MASDPQSQSTDALHQIGLGFRDTAIALGSVDKELKQVGESVAEIKQEIYGKGENKGLRDRVTRIETLIQGNGKKTDSAVEVAHIQGQYSVKGILIQGLLCLLSAIIAAFVTWSLAPKK